MEGEEDDSITIGSYHLDNDNIFAFNAGGVTGPKVDTYDGGNQNSTMLYNPGDLIRFIVTPDVANWVGGLRVLLTLPKTYLTLKGYPHQINPHSGLANIFKQVTVRTAIDGYVCGLEGYDVFVVSNGPGVIPDSAKPSVYGLGMDQSGRYSLAEADDYNSKFYELQVVKGMEGTRPWMLTQHPYWGQDPKFFFKNASTTIGGTTPNLIDTQLNYADALQDDITVIVELRGIGYLDQNKVINVKASGGLKIELLLNDADKVFCPALPGPVIHSDSSKGVPRNWMFDGIITDGYSAGATTLYNTQPITYDAGNRVFDAEWTWDKVVNCGYGVGCVYGFTGRVAYSTTAARINTIIKFYGTVASVKFRPYTSGSEATTPTRLELAFNEDMFADLVTAGKLGTGDKIADIQLDPTFVYGWNNNFLACHTGFDTTKSWKVREPKLRMTRVFAGPAPDAESNTFRAHASRIIALAPNQTQIEITGPYQWLEGIRLIPQLVDTGSLPDYVMRQSPWISDIFKEYDLKINDRTEPLKPIDLRGYTGMPNPGYLMEREKYMKQIGYDSFSHNVHTAQAFMCYAFGVLGQSIAVKNFFLNLYTQTGGKIASSDANPWFATPSLRYVAYLTFRKEVLIKNKEPVTVQ